MLKDDRQLGNITNFKGFNIPTANCISSSFLSKKFEIPDHQYTFCSHPDTTVTALLYK